LGFSKVEVTRIGQVGKRETVVGSRWYRELAPRENLCSHWPHAQPLSIFHMTPLPWMPRPRTWSD